MNAIIQAIAALPVEEQELMVKGYFGSKLFGAIGLSSDDPAELAAKLAEVNSVRESALLKALPADQQQKILELCDDAEDLLKTPDE